MFLREEGARAGSLGAGLQRKSLAGKAAPKLEVPQPLPGAAAVLSPS